MWPIIWHVHGIIWDMGAGAGARRWPVGCGLGSRGGGVVVVGRRGEPGVRGSWVRARKLGAGSWTGYQFVFC
jgi:hypothetical protein